MSEARDEILRRVASAVGDGAAPGAVARTYHRSGTLDPAARLARLRERLLDYRARVETTSAGAIAERAAELAAGGRIGVPPGLPAVWRPPNAVEDYDLPTHELDALAGVLTGCTLAIAETGTVVLTGDAHEGRRALTLVPDLHICVVRGDQVVETVPEAFALLNGNERRPMTFVSGPSATSDIELKRVEGVHGPRRLVVLLVDV